MSREAGRTIESSDVKPRQQAHKHYHSAQDLPRIKTLDKMHQNLAQNVWTQDSVQRPAANIGKNPFIDSSNDPKGRQAKAKNLGHSGLCSISPLAPAP